VGGGVLKMDSDDENNDDKHDHFYEYDDENLSKYSPFRHQINWGQPPSTAP